MLNYKGNHFSSHLKKKKKKKGKHLHVINRVMAVEMISLVVYIVGLKMKGSSWVFVSLCWFRYAGGTHSHFFEHSKVPVKIINTCVTAAADG